MHEMILCKLGEVVLKGLNRRSFEDKLMSNVSRRVAKCGSFRIYSKQSTIYVEPKDDACDIEAAFEGCRRVFGIIAVSKALVTGENLGQVASQTMEALRVTEDVVDLPVLRPLIGMDKEEIVRLSRKIGTFDTSILPYEDCCTVFTPRHPRTKPNLDEVREAEAALDIDGLIDRAMTNREFVRIKF